MGVLAVGVPSATGTAKNVVNAIGSKPMYINERDLKSCSYELCGEVEVDTRRRTFTRVGYTAAQLHAHRGCSARKSRANACPLFDRKTSQ